MKKQILIISLISLVVLTITACGSREQKSPEDIILAQTEASPVEEPAPAPLASLQPEDISLPNQIKDKVEILNGSNGSIPVTIDNNGYPNISITFKLKETVTNTKPFWFSGCEQIFIYGIGQDSEGRDVEELLPSYKEWRTDDRDGSMFKDFLESEPGETLTLEFTGDACQEGKAATSEAVKKLAKFKLKFSK